MGCCYGFVHSSLVVKLSVSGEVHSISSSSTSVLMNAGAGWAAGGGATAPGMTAGRIGASATAEFSSPLEP